MKESTMKTMQASSYLSGGSAAYVEALYEQYLKNSQSVNSDWRNYFASLPNAEGDVSHADIRAYFEELASHPITLQAGGDALQERKQAHVLRLIDAYRTYGHYQAKLDPLEIAQNLPVPELDLSAYELTLADLNTRFNDVLGLKNPTLQQILDALKQTYCGSIGFEYQYITDKQQREWLRQRIESQPFSSSFSADAKKRILQRLTEAEGLEKYLGAKFVAQKRFSLEGGDTLIPMLDEYIQRASSQKVQEIVIGMAHRGRLNVLVNIFGKAPARLFAEFEGKHDGSGTGDVKYHKGFSSDIQTSNGSIHLAMAFNPSHLEIIDPVVEGSVRARQEQWSDDQRLNIIPVLIHGDAAFAGQGIVMETFALSQTAGYKTGGTTHIVINNQVGFTTDPKDSRSSWYCTDIAKMVDAPVFHVNGDDPEAALFVTQLALDFRMQFKKDVVIDLVCYRRHGHNEADEPAATQPVMYQKIRARKTTRKLYADQLIASGVLTQDAVDAMSTNYRSVLDEGKEIVATIEGKHKSQYIKDWTSYLNQHWTASAKTAVDVKTLKKLADKLETVPAGMTLQPQVAKMLEDRRKMTAGELPLNWGYAETLAYATLLNENYFVRISGQDCGRGTFFHRHAVLHDYKNNQTFTPLAHVSENQNAFAVIDSILSEAAVMGFEYGYASSNPKALVIWEAQYGDFVNGAQVVIDQFISSSEQKWARLCGLVLFLPHGYEGAGPEHTSARLERFLQLCAQENMQVCIPTTPAQTFHMLRRQMLRPYRKPLIVMTPKSLLRHKAAVSDIDELTKGEFKVVIPETEDIKPANVKRVVLCSGKVYYDLIEQRTTNKQTDIAIIRVEQLYPFPQQELTSELEKYKKAKEVVWCQEEPKNQGAWYSTAHNLQACLTKDQTLSYVGRDASAAPAVGSPHLHVEQQNKLIKEALN